MWVNPLLAIQAIVRLKAMPSLMAAGEVAIVDRLSNQRAEPVADEIDRCTIRPSLAVRPMSAGAQ